MTKADIISWWDAIFDLAYAIFTSIAVLTGKVLPVRKTAMLVSQKIRIISLADLP